MTWSAGISDATWITIDRVGIVLGIVTAMIAFLMPVIVFLKRADLRGWLLRNRFGDVGEEFTCTGTKGCGLALLVSNKELVGFALKAYRPRAIALISSRDTEKIAEDIARIAENQRIECVGTPFVVSDVDDVQASRDAVASALHALEERDLPVVVDVTGGKKPMSLGAFIAAEEAGQASVYISSEYQTSDALGLSKRRRGSEKAVFISRPTGWGE